MKNFLIGVGILSIFLTAAGCKKAPPQQGPLPVNVVTAIEKEVNEWDEFTGRMEAVESVEIRPRVSGYITEIQFKAGAIVKKGDLLFVIDPRPYQADFDRAAAELERAQAQLKLARDRVGSREGVAGEEDHLRRANSTRKRLRCQQASAAARVSRGGEEFRGAESRVHADQIADRRARER